MVYKVEGIVMEMTELRDGTVKVTIGGASRLFARDGARIIQIGQTSPDIPACHDEMVNKFICAKFRITSPPQVLTSRSFSLSKKRRRGKPRFIPSRPGWKKREDKGARRLLL